MDLKGYAQIKKGEFPHHCMGPVEAYWEHPVRVMDWGVDGSALVITAAGNAMGDFPPEAVLRSFRCSERGHILLPQGLDVLGEMTYTGRCLSRKGGYNQMVRHMVIAASLARGAFTDDFLWQVEREERAREAAGR